MPQRNICVSTDLGAVVAKRRSIEDRRAVCLNVSRKGEALVRKIAPIVQGMEAMLSEEERLTLIMSRPDQILRLSP